MSAWLLWTSSILLEAAILHVVIVLWTPRLVGRFSAAKMRAFAGRLNAIGYRGLPVAGRRALTTNPDMATAFGVYDLSHGPVRIACTLPPWDSYWSISLYAWNTDCFFVINDQTAIAGNFDLIVSRKLPAEPPGPFEMQAVSPSKRGIIVVRMVALDREDSEELSRIEQVIRKTSVVTGAPAQSRARVIHGRSLA